MSDALGYHENPRDKSGIVRARTLGQLRSWDMPRTDDALNVLNTELSRVDYPGVYILFEGKKVYIGQAKDVVSRLRTHMKTPEEKIEKWDRVIIVNDGRPATQSDFNDDAVRKALETYLIGLFKLNRYNVVAQGERQNLNPMQGQLYNLLKDELDFLLLKKTVIAKLFERLGEEEVLSDELRKILEKGGRKVTKWSAHEATIDGERAFIRAGSKKPKGWQVTFRDVFLHSLQTGTGYLLVPRDGVLLIPLADVRDVVADPSAYDQNTIDIWITFTEDNIMLAYKKNSADVTAFRLVQ